MSENIRNITRENYEGWFLDYLDGNITIDREKILLEFLDLNHDLREELDSIAAMKLTATKKSVEFKNKHLLLRNQESEINIPETDYLLIKKMEEGLTNQESERLIQLIKQYPQVKKDDILYPKTKLVPPPIVYSAPNKLIRRRSGLWVRIIYNGVAAAILVMLMLSENRKVLVDENNSTEGNTAFISGTYSNTPTVAENNPETFSAITKGEVLSKKQTVKPENSHPLPTDFEKSDPVDPIIGPVINLRVSSIQINAFEQGLAMMIPVYIQNQRFQNFSSVASEETYGVTLSLLEKGTDILSRLTTKELAFRKVYDSEGNVVAVNVKSGDFEMAQRLPKWLVR